MGPYYDILVRMNEVQQRALSQGRRPMKNIFKTHPISHGEGYFGHLISSLQYSCIYFALTWISLIHAVFPFLFEKTASTWTNNLNKRMQES